jgi:hypothetical protein
MFNDIDPVFDSVSFLGTSDTVKDCCDVVQFGWIV